MSVIVRTKRLPFRKDMPFPQRLRFEHENELYNLTYWRNSYDGAPYLKLKLVKTDELLLSVRLSEGGTHYITKEENMGWVSFVLFVSKIDMDEKDINIKLIDRETMFLQGD